MSDSRKPAEQVRAELRGLARPVAHELRRAQVRAETFRREGLAVTLLFVPVLYLLAVAVAAPFGVDLHLPLWLVLSLTLAVPALRLYLRAREAGSRQVADEAALVAIDRELRLEDRLSAAHEFVGEAEPDGFRLAAIHDAERRLEQARAARPQQPIDAPTSPAPLALAALAALGMIWLASLVPVAWSPLPADGNEQQQVAAGPGQPEPDVRDEPIVPPDDPRPEPTRTPRQANADDGNTSAARDDTPADARRRGKNPLGSGRSAEARVAQGGGSERGSPSDQAQSTKGDKAAKPKEKKKNEARRDEQEQAEKAEKPKEPSGATQGRGSGKGSSKSPTASPWSAKDQVVTDDEQDPEDDEEVDDENDESKARGGVQPNLRQRKPPVNRDLQISMGNGPPPDDANGRGGPGGPKKQRGVAQLVLGVTFPDHVSAKPNPGISKITQERIEPQAQQGDHVDGDSRGRRKAPMGRLSRRVLRPWMQDLVRSFYLSLRKQGEPQ